MKRNTDNKLLAEAYSSIYEATRATYVGVLSHEVYKMILYSDNPSKIDACEYKTMSEAPVFITSSNDEEIIVAYEANSMAEIIKKINAEDWGYDEPGHQNITPTEQGLIDHVNDTFADKDSVSGWILFVNGKPIAQASDFSVCRGDMFDDE